MKISKLPILITLMLTACSSNSSPINDHSSGSLITSTNIVEEKVDLDLPVFIGTEVKEKIDRRIYGTFIEHIDTCIYNGIWSEMIMDRKFHDPVGVGVSQWKKEGDVVNNTDVYKSAPNATTINKDGSISQLGIPLDENKDYNGYFYACGNGKLKLKFNNSD